MIETLPELVISLIANHLSYEDVRSLRVACKRLKEVIDQTKFGSLHLLVNKNPFHRNLFYTDERVYYANTFRVNNVGILSSIKFKTQLSELLKLTIYSDQMVYSRLKGTVNLNELNFFEQLVHLEVLGFKLGNGKLNLKNLKICRLQYEFILDMLPHQQFELDCPQLNALCLDRFPKLSLTQETRRSLRHLSIEFEAVSANEGAFVFGLCRESKNLSTICFTSSEDVEAFVQALLQPRIPGIGLGYFDSDSLPSLKQIKLKKCGFFPNDFFENILRLKRKKATKHIEFWLNSKVMQLDELTKMNQLIRQLGSKEFYANRRGPHPRQFEIRFAKGEVLQDLVENPILDSLLPGVERAFFESEEDAALGKQLIKKLANLRAFSIREEAPLDDDLFESLIRAGKRISFLEISSARVTQQQLDRLPSHFHGLMHINFRSKDFGLRNFDLDFLTKFQNLLSLYLTFNIAKERMLSLFQNCKYQPILRLDLCGKQTLRIDRGPNANGRYEIITNLYAVNEPSRSNIRVEFDSLENVIDYYYENDLFNKT